jgi:TorA maturation chaperone TorD
MRGGVDPRELAGSRAVVYRVLASSLLTPTDERLSRLATAAPELRSMTEPLRGMAFHGAWTAFLDRLSMLTPEEAELVQRDHTTLFVSGARGSCPPYESAHLGPDVDVGLVAAAVDTAYRTAGFVVDAEGEAPDHAAVELDFLSALCSREARAKDPRQGERWRALQRSFLGAHPLRWFPALSEAVHRTRPGSVLAETVEVACRFTEHDLALLEALSANG